MGRYQIMVEAPYIPGFHSSSSSRRLYSSKSNSRGTSKSKDNPHKSPSNPTTSSSSKNKEMRNENPNTKEKRQHQQKTKQQQQSFQGRRRSLWKDKNKNKKENWLSNNSALRWQKKKKSDRIKTKIRKDNKENETNRYIEVGTMKGDVQKPA